MRQAGHLNTELLVRALDDELTSSERVEVESHLATCSECQASYRELGILSVNFESLVAERPVPPVGVERRDLEQELIHKEFGAVKGANLRQWARPASFILAIAASVIFALLFLPRTPQREVGSKAASSGELSPSIFEADGETFVSLPYSNASLPMNAHHVVRMQIPVSSLLDAGVIFEPISNEVTSGDRSVLADVLLGVDGEPLGVHVVSSE